MKLLLIVAVELCWFGCKSASDLCNSHLWKGSEAYDLIKGMCSNGEDQLDPRNTDEDQFENAKSLNLQRPNNFDSHTSDKRPMNNEDCQLDCNDEDEILVKSWRFDYEKLAPDQMMYTKKAIQDILFEGRVGMLKKKSVVINSPYQHCASGRNKKSSAVLEAECKVICKAGAQPSSTNQTTPVKIENVIQPLTQEEIPKDTTPTIEMQTQKLPVISSLQDVLQPAPDAQLPETAEMVNPPAPDVQLPETPETVNPPASDAKFPEIPEMVDLPASDAAALEPPQPEV